MGNHVKAFIIHLNSATERQRQVGRLMRTLPVETEIIDAVRADTLDKAAIDAVYARHIHEPRYPFALRKQEIACFLSHRAAWQAILDQGLDAGLILEDDASLTDHFDTAFRCADDHLVPGAYFRLRHRKDRARGEVLVSSPLVEIVRERPLGLGMVAQLVSREAAAKLLDATRRFDRPVDTTLQLVWMTGVYPLAVQPGGIEEVSSELGGSTISSVKSTRDRLAREILRPLYRWRIAAASRDFERRGSVVGSHTSLSPDNPAT